MANISVNRERLKNQSVNLLSIEEKIKSMEDDVNEIKRQIEKGTSSSYRTIVKKIETAVVAIDINKDSISSMKTILDEVQRLYGDTEQKVEDEFKESNNANGFEQLKMKLNPIDDKILLHNSDEKWKFFVKDLSGENENGYSAIAAAIGISGAILGKDFETGIEADIGNFYTDSQITGEWNTAEGEIGLKGEVKAGVSAAKLKGDVQYGNFDGSLTLAALTGAVTGGVECALFKDGKFQPGAGISGKINGNVVNGEIKEKIGDDDFNVHRTMKGELLGGEAKAETKIGADGVTAGIGAEVYLAKGEVEGGVEFFGIKIDASVEGKAGALGAEASLSATGSSAEAEIGGSLGLGAGIKVKVDWSGLYNKIEKFTQPFLSKGINGSGGGGGGIR